MRNLSERTIVVLGIGLFVLFLLIMRFLILVLLAVLAYLSLALPSEAWKPLNYLTLPPERESVAIQVGNRVIEADVYRPSEWFPSSHHPGLLLFTPLLQEARGDERIVNFGDTFSRLGFVVVLPERPPEDRTYISPEDFEDARSVWRYMHDLPYVDDDRVGVFGLSYGLGPVFLSAASDSFIRERVPFIAGFGGYGDLREAMSFLLTGHFAYGETKGFQEPDEWARAVAIENLEASLPPSPERDALLRAETLEAFDEAYGNLPEAFRVAISEHSPVSVAEEIRAPILLIHSTDDPFIPFTESLRLKDASVNAEFANVYLVNIFRHGDYYPLNAENVRERYLPSLYASLLFLFHLLQFAL